MTEFLKKIRWPYFTFFTLTPILAIAGIWDILRKGGPHWGTWVLAFVMLQLTGLGITAGYHRLFSHKTYETNRWVEAFLLLFGGASFQGPAREWASEHRYHHRYVDKEGDPYNINKGFFYAHMGWILFKPQTPPAYDNVADLDKNKLIYLQDKYYFVLASLAGFVLPAALAALWGDAWGGFMVAGLGRMVLNHHFTFSINSVAHTLGFQNYSDRHSAKDSTITAFLTYGEGYHNFHHEFPSDYRNGIRWFHYDPGKWMIAFFKRIGWVWQVRRMPEEKINLARVQMEEKRLLAKLSRKNSLSPINGDFIIRAKESLIGAHDQWVKLKKEYRSLKKAGYDSMMAKKAELKKDLTQARRDFDLALSQWKFLLKCEPQFMSF